MTRTIIFRLLRGLGLGLDNIMPPNGVICGAEFDAAPGEVRMLAPVGSGGLGQKKPPIFWIGWGLI
jgi:hypothetical protein